MTQEFSRNINRREDINMDQTMNNFKTLDNKKIGYFLNVNELRR